MTLSAPRPSPAQTHARVLILEIAPNLCKKAVGGPVLSRAVSCPVNASMSYGAQAERIAFWHRDPGVSPTRVLRSR